MSKKVETSVAIKEVTNFLKQHKVKEFRRKKMTEAKIKKDYEDVIEAVEDGLLIFEKGVAIYDLRNPLCNAKGEEVVKDKKVKFRARVRPSDKLNVLNGINIEQQHGDYVKSQLSLASQLELAYVEMLSSEDYDVITQIASVF